MSRFEIETISSLEIHRFYRGAAGAFIPRGNQYRLGQLQWKTRKLQGMSSVGALFTFCKIVLPTSLINIYRFATGREMTGDRPDTESDNWDMREDKFVSNWAGVR